MDKSFIENCKLLKKHFTKLSQTDTETQTFDSTTNSNVALDIITEAKKLLLFEQFEALSDADIANLRQNSVVKWADKIEKFKDRENGKKLCQQSHVKWDDEVFTEFVPNPKFNSEMIQKDLQKATFLGATTTEIFNATKGVKIQAIREGVEERMDDLIEKQTGQIERIAELTITGQANTKIETILEVRKCFQESKIDTNKIEFLRTILHKWKNVTKESQVKQAQTQNNHKKIDNFVQNLQNYKLAVTKSKSDLIGTGKITVTKKPTSSSNLIPKIAHFENRFKAQTNIIQTQKAKLEEQARLIEELKLNKIGKAAKESLEKAENDYKKTISESTKLKYKAKPAPITPEPDPNRIELSLNLSKAPKIVQLMEDRAKERFEKRILIQERKRLIENEKKRLVEEAIKKKTEEEVEEKSKRIERMKKQREKVRQLELRKQRDKLKFIELNQKASTHFKQKLLQFGFIHLKNLIYTVKIKFEIAKQFYEHNLELRYFKIWAQITQKLTKIKEDKAKGNYNRNIQYRMFKSWKQYQFGAVQKRQVAIDRYEMSLQIRTFISWHRLICEYHVQFQIFADKADKHYRRILLFQCVHAWRSLPAIMQIERIQNERKRKWRLRVAQILTDYDPTKSNYD